MKIKLKNRIFAILLLTLSIIFSIPAHAQFIDGQSRNRVICDSVSNLEKHVANLPNAESNTQATSTNSTPGCAWLPGKGYMSRIEIGEIGGWLHSGNYIMSVHSLRLSDGRNFVHSSVIRRLDEWRLANDCGVSMWKVQFPNGEKHRFFGTDRNGLKPHCRSLINRQTEANKLNQPITMLSEHWQSRPEDRQINVCTKLESAANGMDKVVNEMQLND